MIASVRQVTARFLGVLSVSLFVVLVGDVLWGVLTRYALGSQAVWTEELARLLLVWLSMLGGALAYADRSHLGVDTLVIALDPASQRVAVFTSHLLILAFAAGVMVYGGTSLTIERWRAGQVLSALPMVKAWFYLSVPVSGALIAVFAVDALLEFLPGRSARPGAPAAVQE